LCARGPKGAEGREAQGKACSEDHGGECEQPTCHVASRLRIPRLRLRGRAAMMALRRRFRAETRPRSAAMSGTKVEQGTLLWVPSDERKQHSRLTDYTQWLRATRNVTCSDWHELHAFSVSDLPAFWQSIWDYFGVAAHAPASAVLRGTLPRVEWFP